MLIRAPLTTASSIASSDLLFPFSTSRSGRVPAISEAWSSGVPRQSPPAPSCDSTRRSASAGFDLIAK
jgi:hypothetical protein